jgi:hypothetical protein
MTNFYSAAYNPVHAVLEGQTPYDRDSTFPPYAPLQLVVHLPFALLPPQVAAITYFLFTILLTLALALLALRLARVEVRPERVLALAGAVLLSRPGHWTLLLGQVSIVLTVLTYVIFVYERSNPTLSGWALCGVLLKPTFGVPVALLLWAWGRRKVAALGVGLAIVVNLPLLALFAQRQGGLGALVRAVPGGYKRMAGNIGRQPCNQQHPNRCRESHQPLCRKPTLEYRAGRLGWRYPSAGRFSSPPSSQTPRSVRQEPRRFYYLPGDQSSRLHRGYDLVLLTAPFVMAVRPGLLPAVPSGIRATILGLFSVLALNWIATESVLARLQLCRAMWLTVTSLSGLCVLVLFLIYLALGMVQRHRSQSSLASERPTAPSAGIKVIGQPGF